MKGRILVAPYVNPDLDGTACAFAYAEFLIKSGKNALAAVSGAPHKEAQFVFNKFNIKSLLNAEDLIEEEDAIILVDASDTLGISSKIDPKKVIEIIDHRKVNESHMFSNAKVHIELVGSAATLIAEKFFNSQIPISKESAALLFSAICSNTINFQANVTTSRDHKMADFLKTKFPLPKNYVHEMFAYKSTLNKPLKLRFSHEIATFKFNICSLGIVQLELIGSSNFINENLEEIQKILLELKKEKTLDLIFLTCIDVEKGFNEFVIVDKITRELVENVLKVKFQDSIAKRKGILMRKEIVPLIKEELEKNGSIEVQKI